MRKESESCITTLFQENSISFGCCMGLATFVPLSNGKSSHLQTALSWEEKLDIVPSIMEALERNGFDFVEAEVALLSPEGSLQNFKTFKKKIQSFSIKPEVFSAFIPPDLKVVGPHVDKMRMKRYLGESIPRVAEVGGKVIIWGSGASRTYPENYPFKNAYKQIEDFIHLAVDYAREYQVCLAIEHMNRWESNTINSLKEAIILAEKVDMPEVQVMVDYYHLMMEEEELSGIYLSRGKVIHVHLSDSDRKRPGGGTFPFIPFIKSLKQIKYGGRISLECNFQEFETESKRGLEFVRDIWEKT